MLDGLDLVQRSSMYGIQGLSLVRLSIPMWPPLILHTWSILDVKILHSINEASV